MLYCYTTVLDYRGNLVFANILTRSHSFCASPNSGLCSSVDVVCSCLSYFFVVDCFVNSYGVSFLIEFFMFLFIDDYTLFFFFFWFFIVKGQTVVCNSLPSLYFNFDGQLSLWQLYRVSLCL